MSTPLQTKSHKWLPSSPIYTAIAGGTAVLLVISIIANPDAAFRASLQGLKVWWSIIFPALLPFLALSHMLHAYGFVHGIGTLLQPLMQLLFRIPGIGGFAWAIGWTAGYPAGADAVIKLRQQKLLTRDEGERLLSLSHASNPVFMIAVVGTGFMQRADIGLYLAIVHWASAILSIVLLRLFSSRDSVRAAKARPSSTTSIAAQDKSVQPFKHILHAMESAHRSDGRPLGKLLGESVTSAVQTLMMIGGYIMIFSVIIQMSRLLIPQQFGAFLLNGLFEVNLGAFTIGSATLPSSLLQIALVSAVLGWSGISVHMQIHSLMKGSDLRYSRFLLSRIIHACVAFILACVCWRPFQNGLQHSDSAQPALAPMTDHTASQQHSTIDALIQWINSNPSSWKLILSSLLIGALFLMLLIVCSSIIALIKRLAPQPRA